MKLLGILTKIIRITGIIYIAFIFLEFILNIIFNNSNSTSSNLVLILIGYGSHLFLNLLKASFYIAFSFLLDLLAKEKNE